MIKRLYKLFPDKLAMMQLTVLNIALALLQGLILGTLVPVVTTFLDPGHNFGEIMPWLAVSGAALLCYVVLTVIATPVGFSASMKLGAQLRNKVMDHIAQLPLGLFTPDNKARFARTITADVGLIAHLVVTIGAPAIISLLVPVSITVVTFFINWIVGVTLLVLLPVVLLALRWAARVSTEEEIKLEKAATQIAGKAIEMGQAQTVLRAAGKGVEGTALLQQSLEQHRIVYRKGLQRATVPFLTFIGTVGAGFIVVAVLTTYLLTGGFITIPEAIVLFILAVRFFEPLSHLTELIGALEAMNNAMVRTQELLDTPTLKMATPAAHLNGSMSIQLENISFAYGKNPVINDVSFYCPPGSTTALVGASGAGKTTLVRLIARFYDTDKGTIKIGGSDIRLLDYNSMMNDIAIIFQDVYLFDGTIRENLLIARPGATEAELAEAATSAQLDEMLARLPYGWNTPVGEGGLQLSGGERQRVSIARAFLKQARIVLIDEAASALDPENEKAISKAIINLASGNNRTVIVIAHRPAPLAAADQVVVLRNGRVAEFGKPKELLGNEGFYHNLYKQLEATRKWDMMD